MSEALNKEVEEIQEEVSEQPEPEDESMKGFVSKEEYVKRGGKPEDWRDPIEYKHKGEMIRLRKELKQDFESQIKNLNLLHEVRLQQERDELLKRRDDAIDTADKAEVKRLDAQIAANDKATQLIKDNPEPPKPQEIIEWEEENPWIFDQQDKRTILANKVLSAKLAEGKSLATALRAVDHELSKLNPPKKDPSQLVEGSRVAGGKRENAGLSFSDLTPQEMKIWDAGLFKDKKAFLKSVENSRAK